MVEQRGPDEWDMQVVWVDTDQLVPNPSNPNQQDDATFNALVESIQTEGWTAPVQVVPLDGVGTYEIVAGEHRWRAARVLGSQVPVIVLPAEDFDQDRRDWNMVKDNLLHGELNPEKFTRLYQRMVEKYDAEVLQALMGFTSEDAFRKVFKEVKAGLPPELQKALEDAKSEIRTIDDLSNVLNRLFREFGDTLDSDYMVFSYGGKEVLWVRAKPDLWKVVNRMASEASEAGRSLADDLFVAVQSAR